MDKKALWSRVCKTDPRHVKPITGKQYQGNSPKPYWIVERLTEEFGPCGIGWGFHIVSERMERMTDKEVLSIATVRLWYEFDGKRGEVEQIGQTKACYLTAKGALLVDEDAPKKSVTDALVKCASYIGFAGDIFSGRWDDSKYVADVRREYEEKDRQESPERSEARAHWLADQMAAIEAASTVGELKRVVDAAIVTAQDERDQDAEAQIRAAAATKAAKAKKKEHA
jgi:hypothetical protein